MLARDDVKGVLQQIIEWQRLSVETTFGLMDGRHNGHGTVTLAASVATTTLADRRISANTKIFLFATTANAAAEAGAGGFFQTYPNMAIRDTAF